MAKIRKKVFGPKPVAEYSQIIIIGKATFSVWGDEGRIDVYRLTRGKWTLLGSVETYSGAKSKILDELTLENIEVPDPQVWLRERAAAR